MIEDGSKVYINDDVALTANVDLDKQIEIINADKIDFAGFVINLTDEGASINSDAQITAGVASGINGYEVVETATADGFVYTLQAVKFTLTLDAGEGRIAGQQTLTFEIANGQTYGEAMNWTRIIKAVRTGYQFEGWMYNNQLLDVNDVFNYGQDVTFEAQWLLIGPGFIIHVHDLDETVKDVIVLTGDGYESYQDIKYRGGKGDRDAQIGVEQGSEDDVANYYYGVSPAKFMNDDHIDPHGNEHFYDFIVPREDVYTVCIRYKDGSTFIYTEEIRATGTVDVTVNGTSVTVTNNDYSVYDIKNLRYVDVPGLTNVQEFRDYNANVIRGEKFIDNSVTFSVLVEGTYSFLVEFVDGTKYTGEFTITAGDVELVMPNFSARTVTNIGDNVDLIRYMEGSHPDLTMKQAKAQGATVISGKYIDRTTGTYNLREDLGGKTVTFVVHFSDVNLERAVVVDIP